MPFVPWPREINSFTALPGDNKGLQNVPHCLHYGPHQLGPPAAKWWLHLAEYTTLHSQYSANRLIFFGLHYPGVDPGSCLMLIKPPDGEVIYNYIVE